MLRGGGLGGEQGHRAGPAPRGVEGEGLHRYRGYQVILTLQHLPFRSGEEGEAAEPRPRADDGGRLQDRDERRRPGHRGQAQHQVGQGEVTLNCTEAGAHTQL